MGELPRTLVTRVIGAHTLIGLEMLGLLIALTGRHIPRVRILLLGAMAWNGFYWGTWMRWLPGLTDATPEPVSLTTLLMIFGVVFAIAGLLFKFASRQHDTLTANDFLLPLQQFGVVLLILVGLFLVRLLQGFLESGAMIAIAILLTLLIGVLWYRQSPKDNILMERHFPPNPLGRLWIVSAGLLFAGMTIFAFQLPLVEINDFNQFLLMELGYLAVGFLWLPLIAARVSIQALNRQALTDQPI